MVVKLHEIQSQKNSLMIIILKEVFHQNLLCYENNKKIL